jgi:predicted component of type VI protein secretion system
MQIRLVLRSGPQAGRTIELQSAQVIGRQGADVELDDPGISRRHASVTPVEQGVYIADLGSSNGTFVNGVRITASTWLLQGDVVVMGATQIAVELSAPQATVVHGAPATAPTAVAAPGPAAQPYDAMHAAPARIPRAATRIPAATYASFATVIATAVALVLYFALR